MRKVDNRGGKDGGNIGGGEKIMTEKVATNVVASQTTEMPVPIATKMSNLFAMIMLLRKIELIQHNLYEIKLLARAVGVPVG